jgi:hypothetical protein
LVLRHGKGRLFSEYQLSKISVQVKFQPLLKIVLFSSKYNIKTLLRAFYNIKLIYLQALNFLALKEKYD